MRKKSFLIMEIKMNITVSYALAATAYIAENYQDGLVLSARISKEYDIPKAYLLRILQHLVKAQVLTGKRGPRGGFTLARDPKEITMLQIIEAVDGSLMGSQYMTGQEHSLDFTRKMGSVCTKAIEKEMEVYDKAKLSDMLK